MAILDKNGNEVSGMEIAIFEESGQKLHKPSGNWYTNAAELKKIQKEFTAKANKGKA